MITLNYIHFRHTLRSVFTKFKQIISHPMWIIAIFEPLFYLMGKRGGNVTKDLKSARSILIIKPDELGDLILLSPFLRELRRLFQNARITLAISPKYKEVVASCPYIDEVLTCCPVLTNRKKLKTSWQLKYIIKAITSFWRKSFDLAIYPRWDMDYYQGSLFTYLSGAPARIGFSSTVKSEKYKFNANYEHYFTHVINDSSIRHEVEQNLSIIKYLGKKIEKTHLETWLRDDPDFIKHYPFNKTQGPIFCFSTEASNPKGEWPLVEYSRLSSWLIKNYQASIYILGQHAQSSGENPFLNLNSSLIFDLRGKTSLRQAASVIKRCQFYVGNDTGLKHLASCYGLEIVEISSWPKSGNPLSNHSPHRFETWKTTHYIVNPDQSTYPCHGECKLFKPHCILNVKLNDVIKVLDGILATKRSSTLKQTTII